MINSIRTWFNNLSPEWKRRTAMFTAITSFVVVMLIAYYTKESNDEPIQEETVPVASTSLDFTDRDEDLALRIGLKNELAEVTAKKDAELEAQKAEISELKNMINALSSGQVNRELPLDNQYGDLKLNSIPPPVNYGDTSIPTEEVRPAPIVINGSIGVVTVKNKLQSSNDNTTIIPKVLKNFISAGSILKATLLNGMYAPTMGKGQDSPYPALMRLWDLGFLPNAVRKDLSGCFVLGDAYGELSDSRVHIRLNKLSCISDSEKRVLEKDIKGFVNGDDGKVGIYGEIRANFGELTLAALLAEFIAAAGETVKTASQNVVQNPLGGITTTFPATSDIIASAAGSGFGEAAEMIAEFYINIMKEMSPVIEIHGRRDVEIIISNGIELTLDDYEWLGVKRDETDSFIDIDK